MRSASAAPLTSTTLRSTSGADTLARPHHVNAWQLQAAHSSHSPARQHACHGALLARRRQRCGDEPHTTCAPPSHVTRGTCTARARTRTRQIRGGAPGHDEVWRHLSAANHERRAAGVDRLQQRGRDGGTDLHIPPYVSQRAACTCGAPTRHEPLASCTSPARGARRDHGPGAARTSQSGQHQTPPRRMWLRAIGDETAGHAHAIFTRHVGAHAVCHALNAPSTTRPPS